MKSRSVFIKTNKIIGPLIIAGLGILASVWTNGLFELLVNQHPNFFYHSQYKILAGTIYTTIQYEYRVIGLVTIIALIWGLNKDKKKYLYPWSCLKFCENIVIVICTIKVLQNSPFLNITIPLGLAALCINTYVLLCVYKSYKRMMIPLPPRNLYTAVQDNNQDVKINLENSYPQFSDVRNNEENNVIPATRTNTIEPAVHNI